MENLITKSNDNVDIAAIGKDIVNKLLRGEKSPDEIILKSVERQRDTLNYL